MGSYVNSNQFGSSQTPTGGAVAQPQGLPATQPASPQPPQAVATEQNTQQGSQPVVNTGSVITVNQGGGNKNKLL